MPGRDLAVTGAPAEGMEALRDTVHRLATRGWPNAPAPAPWRASGRPRWWARCGGERA